MEHPFVHDPGMGISWKLWPQASSEADTVAGPVQFEYTWVPNARKVWWDLSMIDAGAGAPASGKRHYGPPAAEEYQEEQPEQEQAPEEDPEAGAPGITHPFAAHGLSLQPHRNGQAVMHVDATGESAAGAGVCKRIECPAGEGVCRQAYNAWNDWGQQHDCEEDVSLELMLCG